MFMQINGENAVENFETELKTQIINSGSDDYSVRSDGFCRPNYH